MAEKLSVQIALEGGQEIVQQLGDIGKAGQKAFADIAKSAGQVGSFSQIKPEQITASLQKMGVEGVGAINKIQAAVQSAVRLERVVAGVRAAETAFGRLGAVGATVFSKLDAAVGKFGANLTRALGPLAGAARALGPVGIAAGALAAGSVALVKFAAAAEDAYKAFSQLQQVSGQSVQNLSTLSNVFAQGGTNLKTFASEMGNLSEKIAAAGSQRAIRAADQDTVKWANDVDRVRRQFERLISGVDQFGNQVAAGIGPVLSPLITLETKVQAVLELLSKVPAEMQQFKLADIFKGLSSDLERAQLGKGLGLSPETIATLSQGSARLQQLVQQARELGLAFDALDQKNLQQMIESQNQAGALFDSLKQKMGALVAPAITSFWEGFTNQLQKLTPVFTQIASSIGQINFSAVGAAAANFLAVLAKIAAGWAQILSGNVRFADVLGQLLQEAGQILASMAVQIGIGIGQGIIQGIISAITNAAGAIWNAIKAALGLGGGGDAGAGAGVPGKARGGLMGGRGTGTSDSNLAWVSRGEYITPARAVRQPGVLAFLEALRRSGGNLSRVLDGMGRFALGGLVPGPMPAFAAGGLAGGMSNVTIQFPGLPEIGGLRASSSAVDELRKAAAMAQVRSGGRKPSRYS